MNIGSSYLRRAPTTNMGDNAIIVKGEKRLRLTMRRCGTGAHKKYLDLLSFESPSQQSQ